jgi:transcriptional regulator with XRE-family HTH domain
VTDVTDSINTPEGLAHLARIVRTARGRQGLRTFAREVGLDPMTIRRLERELTQNPSDITFTALSNVVGFSFEELKAIASSRQPSQSSNQIKARNQLNLLPDSDAATIIVERLGRMQSEDLARILRAIADRLANP